MCFYTDKNQTALIAEKDIICWKALGRKIQKGEHKGLYPAQVRDDYFYKIGVLNPKVPIRKSEKGTKIYRGYHSYTTRNVAFLYCGNTHKFIIPKGTRYFVNFSKTEMVSEQIIMVR